MEAAISIPVRLSDQPLSNSTSVSAKDHSDGIKCTPGGIFTLDDPVPCCYSSSNTQNVNFELNLAERIRESRWQRFVGMFLLLRELRQ